MKSHNCHQLTLLNGGLEPPPPLADETSMSVLLPPAARRNRLRQRNRKPHATSTTPSPAPAPYRAPRGDLFRELAESHWAAPDNTQPMPEDVRGDAYRSLASSVGASIYRRRKRLKGPIEKLRRAVGSNRYSEFTQWLKRIRSIHGASIPVRYYSLLSLIDHQIDEITIEFRYTYDDFDDTAYYSNTKNQINSARELIIKARLDVAELQPLLMEMATLYSCLRAAKRVASLPALPVPVAMVDEERRACRVREAQRETQAARDARVAESRKWLRELAEREKLCDDDVRYGGGWLTLNCAVEMLCDDLRGYNSQKPLWVAIPTIDQLAEDYKMTKRDAGRVLAAYTGRPNQE